MSKIRVHELAKQLNKESKDIIDILEKKGITGKKAVNSLEEKEIDIVKKAITTTSTVKTEDKPVVKTETATQSNKKTEEDNSHITKVYHPQNSSHSTGADTRTDYKGQRSPNNRPQGDRPQGGYNNNRPQGDRPQGGYNNNRPQGDRPQGGYNNNRPQGDRPQGGYNNNRPQGDRPQGGYNNNRPQGDRPQGSYNNNRPQGDRPQGGYNNNRPQGDRPQGGYNNRPQGDRPQGGYNNNRPQGGYNNNRPQGDRPQGTYNNNRPQGGYNNNRPQGGYNNNRPQGGMQGGYNKDNERPQGGYNKGQGARGPAGREKSSDAPLVERPVVRPQIDRASKTANKPKFTPQQSRKNQREQAQIQQKTLQKVQPKQVKKKVEEKITVITLPETLSIQELAAKMKIQPSAIVKKLFIEGKIVTINQEIEYETAEEIALGFDIISEKEEVVDVIEEMLKEEDDEEATLVTRPPVVCVMGHVDHGKTSLLDAIKKTEVTAIEAGGITQHIGAYTVESKTAKITFLDTPGHEAFTAMRMRGAQATDIAILVVAADDGVMPQTIEAISHAKAADISIIVAINKIDKPSANIERVKQELAEQGLLAEDWGGDITFVPVSAHTGEGIDVLLEMVSLTADILELKSNPDRKARGIVIEAQLDKGRGPVATVLVQKGTLKIGDSVAAGSAYGKVRAMVDDKGRRVKEALPSTPVEILGLNNVPNAGEIFVSTDTEKEARNFAETFISEGRVKLIEGSKSKIKMSLDDLFTQIQAGDVKELGVIIKADVQGSVEAMKQSLLKLNNEEVIVRVVHGGVGAINESDVTLASASNSIIIGFNVRPDNMAKQIADNEGVDLRLYKVIYNAIEDIQAAMKGMLDPVFEEKVIAHAEIRQIFKASGIGNIAGSYVLDGTFKRGCQVRIKRAGKQVHEGPLASLKRFKDDVKEVKAGYECGLVFEQFNEFEELDIVEAYIMQEVPR